MHPRPACGSCAMDLFCGSGITAQTKSTETRHKRPAFRFSMQNRGANVFFRRMRRTLNGVLGAYVPSLSAF
jgi:hypothetical protein